MHTTTYIIHTSLLAHCYSNVFRPSRAIFKEYDWYIFTARSTNCIPDVILSSLSSVYYVVLQYVFRCVWREGPFKRMACSSEPLPGNLMHYMTVEDWNKFMSKQTFWYKLMCLLSFWWGCRVCVCVCVYCTAKSRNFILLLFPLSNQFLLLLIHKIDLNEYRKNLVYMKQPSSTYNSIRIAAYHSWLTLCLIMCSLARFIPRISMLMPYSYGNTVINFAPKDRNVGKWNYGSFNTLCNKDNF
jgi:hypothetical protein